MLYYLSSHERHVSSPFQSTTATAITTMSTPSPKPTPTRRGTLNFGLRRKSSAASLTPSVGSAGSPPNSAPIVNGNGNGHTEEPIADDNASVSSKTDKRPPKKRMFSLLAPRASKSSMPSVDLNGHTQEPSEISEAGSDAAVNGAASTASLGSSFFSSPRRGSGANKLAVEALTQEKKRLEEQVQTLTTEKTTLEADLEAAKSETQRLSEEAEKNRGTWVAEGAKAQEELAQKDEEVKSLTATLEEMKEELTRTKASELELAVYKESVTSDLEAKLAENEKRVRETVKEELGTDLANAQKTIELKDSTIERMIAEAAALQEQLAAAQKEAKELKDEREAWIQKETDMQTQLGKVKGAGGCSIM